MGDGGAFAILQRDTWREHAEAADREVQRFREDLDEAVKLLREAELALSREHRHYEAGDRVCATCDRLARVRAFLARSEPVDD